MASGWMIRSAARRRASSAAANAVVSSGYPITTKSAMMILPRVVSSRPPLTRRDGPDPALGEPGIPHPPAGESHRQSSDALNRLQAPGLDRLEERFVVLL